MAEKWEKAASNHGLEGSRISPLAVQFDACCLARGCKSGKGTHASHQNAGSFCAAGTQSRTPFNHFLIYPRLWETAARITYIYECTCESLTYTFFFLFL